MNFLLRSLEKAMNAYLKLDHATLKRFQKLNNSVVTVVLLPTSTTFQLAISDNGVSVLTHDLLPTDATITGTPLQLLGVMINKTNRNAFFADDVRIEGNAEISRQVIELFDELDIDWEEILAEKIGDTKAHHLMSALNSVRDFLSQTEKRFTQDVNEYLHEEGEFFPTREALNDFFNDIDQLRMDVDRLEARLASLKDKEQAK